MPKYNLSQLRGAWGAGRAQAIKNGEISPLEGKFFHSFDEDNKLNWQGRVLHSMPDEYFLIQLYSWLDGRPTAQRIISFKDMINWIFYASKEEWGWAADDILKRQGYTF